MAQDLYAESLRTFMAPVNHLMDDPEVSEVMINGYQDVYIEKKGKITKVESKFDERSLSTLAINIAQFVGRTLNVETPRLDARLPDGSRIHVVIPPIAKNGIIISIRKFFKEKLSVEKLIQFGSFTKEASRFIQVCVELKKNMIISGGTGSGKTTLLNVLSNYIPYDERIITMEDALELQLSNEHVVRFETRHKDKFGKGEVSMGDLLHSSLRLRPDRIILGEVRGSECFDLLQAMNTGHGGSMATVHANTPVETMSRLESLVLMSGIELPLRAIRSQVSSAINIVIAASRYSDGSRRVSHISEILPLDKNGDYQIQDIFIYTQTHRDENGKIHGYFAPTGVLPTFINLIKTSGFKDVDEDFFNPATYKLEQPPFYMGINYFTGKKGAGGGHGEGGEAIVKGKAREGEEPKKEVVKEEVKAEIKKEATPEIVKKSKPEFDMDEFDISEPKKEVKKEIPKEEPKAEVKKAEEKPKDNIVQSFFKKLDSVADNVQKKIENVVQKQPEPEKKPEVEKKIEKPQQVITKKAPKNDDDDWEDF